MEEEKKQTGAAEEAAETAAEAETEETAQTESPETEAPETETREAASQEKERRFGRKKEGELKKKLEALKAETEAALAAEKDKYLRLAAEFDNFKKRSQKEREALYQDVRSDTILKLLPVYDNLERALRQETADEAYKKGVELTMSQLESIFEGMGVKSIETVGKPFDPSVHDAVMHVEDENAGEGEIVEEFQKGFTLGDKVIRFSMVKVAN